MKKEYLCLLLSFLLCFTLGCDLLEWALTDIGGWNLSACVDGYDTCWELFMDNKDFILDGEQGVNNALNFP